MTEPQEPKEPPPRGLWRGFKVGDRVTPIYTSDYHLTLGKVYKVVSYDPRLPKDGEVYVWPPYVEVIDDRGILVSAFARRFKLA